ncbi:MAG: hypothetical protein OHK0045_22850 [Raineya sp.]
MLGFGLVFDLKNNFSQEASRIEMQMNSLNSAAKGLDSAMSSFKGGFAMASAGLALLAPLKNAVSVSMDFNKAISEVGAISNASAEDMQKLKQQAMDLGASTAFTAKQVAEGQKFLSMAGFQVNETLTAMPSLLELAAAAQMDLGKASDIASNLMSMFGMKADELSRINDVLAKTASRSNVSITQIAESMKYMGPIANALSVPIEEVASMIGILGDNGLQGGVATRTVASAMQRFAKPTSEMKAMMKDLNIQMFNSQGQFIGLSNMIAEVEKATKGMTDEQKLNVAATMFGKEASKNFLTLLNASKTVMTEHGQETLKGSEALRGFKQELDRAGGSAGEMARRQLDNLAGDVTIFNSSLEGLLISLGDKLEPILRPIVQFVSNLMSQITSFVNTGLGKALVYIIGGVGVILTILGTLKMAGLALGFITPILKGMAMSAYTALVPLLPFIAVGALLVGAFLLVRQALQEFDDFMSGASKRATGFGLILQRIGGVLRAVGQIFSSWDGNSFDLGGMEAQLQELGILDFVVSLGTYIVRVKEFFMSFANSIQQAFALVGNVIGKVFTYIKQAFQPLIKLFFQLFPALNKNTSGLSAWANAGKYLGYIISGVLIAGIVSLTFALGSFAVALLAATWPILAIIAAVWAVIWVFNNWGAIMDWFAGLWSSFTNFLTEVWTSSLEYLLSVWSNFTTYLYDLWSEFVDWIFGIPEKFIDWGANMIESIKQGILNAWEAFKQWFLDKIMEIPGVALALELMSGDMQVSGAAQSDKGISSERLSSLGEVASKQKAMMLANSVQYNNTITEKISEPINISLNIDGEQITKVVNGKNENNRNRR